MKRCEPLIADFAPRSAYPGSLIVLVGHNFATRRELNKVFIGGHRAIVVTAERHRLVVICHYLTRDGPVHLKTPTGKATGPRDFIVTGWPSPGPPDKDAPPYSFEGVGAGVSQALRQKLLSLPASPVDRISVVDATDIPGTGTAKVLCVCMYPKDTKPADLTAAKQNMVNLGTRVTTYYQQASYGKLNVVFDVTDFFEMLDNLAWYYSRDPPTAGDKGYPNFIYDRLPQIFAEAADNAINARFNLDSYDVLLVECHLGVFVRAWGGGVVGPSFDFQDVARYGPNLHIHHVIGKTLGSIALGDDADWGRVAHEFGHNIVASPSAVISEEDLYNSDLPPGADFTAQEFDLMGDHDKHPLLSAYHMNELGWYNPSTNVRSFDWSTTPKLEEIDIVAHGLGENTNASRYHLVKIVVGTGLEYWIEVRQRPGSTAQVFDSSIPVQGALDGGVVITRAIRGVQNNNQSMRLITLLQTNTSCLKTSDVAVDPARTILITVVDDNVQAQPRVCKVRIEWAQPTQPTPNGTFDLWISPWNTNNYTSPDIWIDRSPFGSYDRVDGTGQPINGGDNPRVGEVNLIKARIHNSGTQGANNIQVTFYTVTPPGVGDNGSWTPLTTVPINAIAAGSQSETSASWTPTVGQHTCLQVHIGMQTGESSLGNNMAQENVFNFQPASHSIPEPVELPVAIRNPLDQPTLVVVQLDNVPEGFYVYFPHRIVALGPLAERQLELLVVPLREIPALKYKIARIRVSGWIPHGYTKPQASVIRPIGGLQAVVAPKTGSQIRLDDPPKLVNPYTIEVSGAIEPVTADQKVRVDLSIGQQLVMVTPATTDRRGRFTAGFKLRRDDNPSVVNAVTLGGLHPAEILGTLASRTTILDFQAHIVNATVLAQADSNVVYYKYTETDTGPEIPR